MFTYWLRLPFTRLFSPTAFLPFSLLSCTPHSLSAYSLQMRPCPATDNLPADSAEIITLANFAPETCNGGLGTFCFLLFSLVSVCVFSGTALEDERTNWRLSIGAIGALTGPMYYLHASENTSVSHTHWNTQKHTLTKTGEKWYSHPPFTCANITYIRACSIIFLILCITLTSFCCCNSTFRW